MSKKFSSSNIRARLGNRQNKLFQVGPDKAVAGVSDARLKLQNKHTTPADARQLIKTRTNQDARSMINAKKKTDNASSITFNKNDVGKNAGKNNLIKTNNLSRTINNNGSSGTSVAVNNLRRPLLGAKSRSLHSSSSQQNVNNTMRSDISAKPFPTKNLLITTLSSRSSNPVQWRKKVPVEKKMSPITFNESQLPSMKPIKIMNSLKRSVTNSNDESSPPKRIFASRSDPTNLIIKTSNNMVKQNQSSFSYSDTNFSNDTTIQDEDFGMIHELLHDKSFGKSSKVIMNDAKSFDSTRITVSNVNAPNRPIKKIPRKNKIGNKRIINSSKSSQQESERVMNFQNDSSYRNTAIVGNTSTNPDLFDNPGEKCKIRISNLHPSVTEEDVIELFGIIGNMKQAKLIKSGLADVTYIKMSDAEEAVKQYHLRELDGLPMIVKIFDPPSTAPLPISVMDRLAPAPKYSHLAEEEAKRKDEELRQREEDKRKKEERLHEQRMNEQRMNEQRMNEQRMNEQRMNEQRMNEQRMNEQRMNEQRMNEQRMNEQRINEQRMNEQRMNDERLKQKEGKRKKEDEFLRQKRMLEQKEKIEQQQKQLQIEQEELQRQQEHMEHLAEEKRKEAALIAATAAAHVPGPLRLGKHQTFIANDQDNDETVDISLIHRALFKSPNADNKNKPVSFTVKI